MATLLKGLARKKELLLSAILLNEGRLAEEARCCGVDVKVIPESKKNFLEIFAVAAQYLQGKDIRILHSHRYKENLLAALLAWRCKVPFVVRSQQGLAEPYGGFKRHKQALLHLLDRIVARYATDRLICASDDLRNEFLRYVEPQKVVTIHNAVDREQACSSLSLLDAKKRLGLPQDCWVIGSAGRLEPIKRLDIFLSAASQIAARLPNTRFVVVGDGSQEAPLRELAKTKGLQERALFLGHRTDIYDVLRAFDILVSCSDHEGLPTVLLESLCLGVPVVARSVGGIPEVIQDGVTGVLVDTGDPSALAEACVGILTDGVRRQRLASAGISWVAGKFAAEQTAAKVAKLYCSLWTD